MNSASLPSSATVKTPRAQRSAATPPPVFDGSAQTTVPESLKSTATIAALKNARLNGPNPWKPKVNERDWKYLVLHHTASNTGSVASIHETHRRRRDGAGNRWLGIGYHFVIGNGRGMRDGEIQPTFRWARQLHGAHAGVADYNQSGIGIVLVGNFEQNPPTAAQLKSAKRLVRTLRTAYAIDRKNIVTHGDVKNTACPGRHFSLAKITAIDDGVTLSASSSFDHLPLTFADSRDVQ